jgi:hypothetical protein
MMLGRMMSSAYRPYGYGYGYGPSYYDSYTPYRARYGEYMTTTPSPIIQGQAQTPAPPPKKDVDLCTLARWNREIPFSELPNMVLDFLANDTISGTSTSQKAEFVFTFFKASVDAYENYNSSSDIFTIPVAYDLKKCNFQSGAGFDVTKPAPAGPEEPLLTAVRSIINMYSNQTTDSSKIGELQDIVSAVKECLPRGGVVLHPEVLPCLDFSLTPDQLLKLEEPHSIFANGEVCKRHLNPDMFKCVKTPTGKVSSCTVENLLALNVFARNYYLCTDELEKSTAERLKTAFEGHYVSDGAVTLSASIFPGLVLFGVLLARSFLL